MQTNTVEGLFREFRSQVPLQRKTVGANTVFTWEYYESGTCDEGHLPIVLLPGASGTADCFFKQILGISCRGYRVISLKYPALYYYDDFISSFDRILDAIRVEKLHLFGTALGGFLAQIYAQERPERIESLILCNTFCDSTPFAEQTKCLNFFSFMPEFFLKKIILDNFPHECQTPEQIEAVDFMVKQVDKLSRTDVAARLVLNTTPFSVDSPRIDPRLVTVIQSYDCCATPQYMIEQTAARYPDCKEAGLKTGGDFPYLSCAAEFNMMIELHLRNVRKVKYGEEYTRGKPSLEPSALPQGSSHAGETPTEEDTEEIRI